MINLHYSASAALACCTTNTNIDTFVGIRSIGVSHVQRRVTATTANTLRQNTVTAFLLGLDITVIKNIDRSAIT